MIAIATLVLAILTGLVSPGVAGELCLLPSAANGVNVSVNCVELRILPNEWIGYRSGGGNPCQYNPGAFCLFSQPDRFGWTISGSQTSPYENTAAAPGGTGQLYLWYVCGSHPQGLASSEFDVGGTIAVHSFTPLNGFLNAGDATHLLLAIGGCPMGPILAGTFQVHDPVAVESETWGMIKSMYR